MKVAFDIDDTLIIPSIVSESWENEGNMENIAKYMEHKEKGDYMILWSGSGTTWAHNWNEKLQLNADEIRVKMKYEDSPVDICYDDCIVDLAKVNIKVKRVRNSISRKEWNKTKRK